MPSSRKKVIVRKYTREWLAGYVSSYGFASNGGIEILDLAGKVVEIPLSGIKWLCFVRDFSSGDAADPERLLRKSFVGRPRTEGLWLRATLQDDDRLEGLATNDLTLLDPEGIFLIPPDIRSNTQRVFLPRPSIAALEIVAVITSPSRHKPAAPGKTTTPLQEDLFHQND
jgi:hypothetical protein